MNITVVRNLILHKMEKEELNSESKEALRSILQEYEIHSNFIQQQLEICKKEHVDLRAEITRLVEENRHLVIQLKLCSESELYKGDATVDKSDVVDNLQQQLALALQEKKSIQSLWKLSLNEVDTLKEKLQYYQSGKVLTVAQRRLSDAQKDYTEAIKILESRISVLKAENSQLIAKIQMSESQLIEVTSQMALLTEKTLSLNSSLKEAVAHEQEWKSRYLSLEAKYIELDRSYQIDQVKFAHTHEFEKLESQLREKLDKTLKERDDLQTALERCHERMAELLRSTANDRSRIEEAVALVEGAIQGRDEALAREAMSVEEIKKMKAELKNLVEQAGLRVAQEEVDIRKQFDNQLTTLEEQMKIVEQEHIRKCVEVQQLQKECDRLQAVLDQGHIQDLSVKRGKKLEKVYQELQVTETECLQLSMENQELRKSLTRLQDRCRKNSQEKIKLIHDLRSAEQQGELCQNELAVTTQRADLLNTQLHHTSLELARLQSETLFQRDTVTTTQARISDAHMLELYKQLDESYGKMNDKNEDSLVTDAFH